MLRYFIGWLKGALEWLQGLDTLAALFYPGGIRALLLGLLLPIIGVGAATMATVRFDFQAFYSLLHAGPTYYLYSLLIVFSAFLVIQFFFNIDKIPYRIAFGDGVEHGSQEGDSWKHITIRLQKRFPWESNRIQECTVEVYYQGMRLDAEGVKLHWQSLHDRQPQGVEKIELRLGQEERIPLVRRFEKALLRRSAETLNAGRLPPGSVELRLDLRRPEEPTTWLTDDEWFTTGNKRHMFSAGLRERPIVKIQSGRKKWKQSYYVDIPPEDDSNLGFRCERATLFRQ